MVQVVQQSQKSLWESFQRLLGVEQPPVAPIGQTPQANTNPFAPEFLEGLKKFGANQNKIQPTPFTPPAQDAYGRGFGGGGGANNLPPDSYAAAIKAMVQRYQR